MARTPNTLTDEERDERRQAQRRQLENALAALLTSEGWRRWLQTRATLHAYSANNTLLIAHQASARGLRVSHVAGFRTWLKLGRCVRQGEKGLTIWAPMRVKVSAERAQDPEERKTIFRTAAVFDVSQTDPLPGVELAPLAPPSLGEIEGASHADLIPRLEMLALELGYEVSWTRELPSSAKGLCRRKERRIEVLDTIAPNQGVSVLIHEICHALVGEREELRAIDYALEEIVVESATYIACASAGLATDVDSVPYVAGWAGDSDPLVVVREAAKLIDELARLVEDSILAEAPERSCEVAA